MFNPKAELVQRFEELREFIRDKQIRLAPRDEANFLRQLSLMMDSGIDFVQALIVLEESMDGPSQKLAKQLSKDLCEGKRLGKAIDNASDRVSDVTPALIRAGEKCGALSQTLRMAGNWAEVASEMRAKVKTALVYPVFVLLVNAVLAVGMLVYVLPTFQSLYKDEALPWLTDALIACSGMVRSPLFWLIVVLGGLELFLFFTHTDHKIKLHRFCLKIPVLSTLLRDASRAKFCSILAITSKTGISVLESLELSAEASGDPEFLDLYPYLHQDVTSGDQLADHFIRRIDIYGAILAHGMALCEETGNMDGVSARLAEFFRLETDYRIEQFQALMEPVLISFVSATTAVILLAIYLPLVRFLEGLLG